MRKLISLRCLSILFALSFFTACSNSTVYNQTGSDVSYTGSGPYKVVVDGIAEPEKSILRKYVELEFSQSLSISDQAKSEIRFFFTAEATENNIATWRDATGLIEIVDSENRQMWLAEYNYKGGMELSGFAVRTRSEAAKLIIRRLHRQFANNLP